MRTSHFAFILLLVLSGTAVFLVAPAQTVQAQQACPQFHALIQAELFPENPVREGDVWGGPVYAYIGEQVLIGRYSGNSGIPSSHGVSNTGVSGSDAFDFGNGDVFIATARHDSFPMPPSLVRVGGTYRAADKLTEGKGRFQNASGNLSVSGPFVLWDLDKPLPRGRWNGVVDGSICGIQ